GNTEISAGRQLRQEDAGSIVSLGGIVQGDTRPSDTAPPLTDFCCCWWVSTLVDTVDPRHALINLHRIRISRELNEEHPRMAWIY
ncbi:hypothetical protein, partial [Stenotrophomonas sepilia]|uniref:hypothetical protein n=1 Tax=Stenotrophomonas sepilia TaxID=2860290 RepID=UPI002E7A7807